MFIQIQALCSHICSCCFMGSQVLDSHRRRRHGSMGQSSRCYSAASLAPISGLRVFVFVVGCILRTIVRHGFSSLGLDEHRSQRHGATRHISLCYYRVSSAAELSDVRKCPSEKIELLLLSDACCGAEDEAAHSTQGAHRCTAPPPLARSRPADPTPRAGAMWRPGCPAGTSPPWRGRAPTRLPPAPHRPPSARPAVVLLGGGPQRVRSGPSPLCSHLEVSKLVFLGCVWVQGPSGGWKMVLGFRGEIAPISPGVCPQSSELDTNR